MCKELTEAWKSGKLKSGWYWVKTPIALGEKPAFLCDDNNFDVDRTIYPNNYDLEVLSSCDYNHFVELTEKVKELKRDVKTITNNYKLLEKQQAENLAHGQALVDEFGDFEGIYEKLQNLRSLLKECHKNLQVAAYNPETDTVYNNITDLLTHINAAIGESEK